MNSRTASLCVVRKWLLPLGRDIWSYVLHFKVVLEIWTEPQNVSLSSPYSQGNEWESCAHVPMEATLMSTLCELEKPHALLLVPAKCEPREGQACRRMEGYTGKCSTDQGLIKPEAVFEFFFY